MAEKETQPQERSPEDAPEPQTEIRTGGGAHVEGEVTVEGGQFVGRDSFEVRESTIFTGPVTIHPVYPTPVEETRPEAPPLPDVPCPYRGLEPFEAEHAAFYMGREQLTQQLVDRVKACTFVAVVGPSGCGKSSLVRAGLTRALRREGEAGWGIQFFRPGTDPVRALAAALAALLEPEADRITRTVQVGQLADHLASGRQPVADVAASLRELYPDLSRVVVVADQFEELYTECEDEQARQRFVAALLALSGEGMVVTLTLRADFYGRALSDRALGEAIDAGLVNVLPMSQAGLRAAIEQPATRVGRTFEPGLVDAILADLGGEPGNLPLLEYALKELWARQTPEGVLTHAAYAAIGRVDGAIAQRAEAIYAALAEAGWGDAVRRVLLRLTHYGHETAGTRRRAAMQDLVTPHTPRAVVDEVVQALSDKDARLLVTGQGDSPSIEVAHEALIRSWAQLGRWLDADRAFGLWREKLSLAWRTWAEAERDEGSLLRGAVLAEAESWLEARREDLNEGERAFIETSLSAQQRDRRTRQRRRYALIFVGTLASILAVLGLWQPTKRSILRRQALTSVSMIQIPASTITDGEGRPLEVAAFQIEAVEVTNRRYLKCVEAQVCSRPNAPPALYDGPEREDYPVIGITALQATQFCTWIGRRLPTDPEWERAARYTDQRPWPWGQEAPSPERANFKYDEIAGYTDDERLQPVGQTIEGVSEEGAYDLAGNAWEWTSSAMDPERPPWTDISQGPPPALSVRGGGAHWIIEDISTRLTADPFYSLSTTYIGCRCAAGP